MADDAPKIIVDDDWKSQAKKEKEKLASQSGPKAAPAQGAGAAGVGGGEGAGRVPDELSFDGIVRMLASQGLMYMGAIPDPQTGKAVVALDLAKMHVDMLSVLEEKTKGNLTDKESEGLTEILAGMREQFVQTARMVQQAQAEGRIGSDGVVSPPSDGGGPGGVSGMAGGTRPGPGGGPTSGGLGGGFGGM